MHLFKFILPCLLLLTGSYAHAYQNFDECGEFEQEVLKNLATLSIDELPVKEIRSFGFEFDFEFSDEPSDQVSNIYGATRQLYVDELELYQYDNFRELDDEGFYAINGKIVFDLTREEFGEEIAKDKIELKLWDDTILQFEKRTYDVLDISVTPIIDNIYELNPKAGTFGTSFTMETEWFDDRIVEIGNRIFKKALIFDPEVVKYKDNGFYCSLSSDFLKKTSWRTPAIEVDKFRSEVDTNEPVFYITYFPENKMSAIDCMRQDQSFEYCSNGSNLITEASVSINKTKTYQGTIANVFNLRKFPFDQQEIKFVIMPEDEVFNSFGAILLNLSVFGDSALDTTSRFETNNEWEFLSYNYAATDTYSEYVGQRIPSLQWSFQVKRNFEYYIFKLLLPIILLLTLTWSIFWIDPKELEARVTISIVTFLALIAYNFVIDKDLAKLAYLTFLDALILVSYLFAGLPTFMAIYCKRQILNGNNDWSDRLNSMSKIGFPTAYAMSVGFVVVVFEVSKKIHW